MATKDELPPEWKLTDKPRPAAVRTLLQLCNVDYKIRPYLYAEHGRPKMRMQDLKEDYTVWSSGERLITELAIHLFNAREQKSVSLSRMAKVLDNQNWRAVQEAIARFR